jgi:hypothetical protein
MKRFVVIVLALLMAVLSFNGFAVQEKNNVDDERAFLNAFHSITSKEMYDLVKELSSNKFKGRLSGSPEYYKSAEWVAGKLKEWGVKPSGNNGTYFQDFDQPYTDVKTKGELILHIQTKAANTSSLLSEGKDIKDQLDKKYIFEEDYYPGANSDKGNITADVVYAGYGISAPELNYDDYENVDVKGKIVLFDSGIPFKDKKNIKEYVQWVNYESNKVKLKIAAEHGAIGVLMNGRLVTSPNSIFNKGVLTCRIGQHVTDDIFFNTGKNSKVLLKQIQDTMKPASFNTGKKVTMIADTEHHADTKSCNVIGMIEGSDPVLKNEYIMIGGHLDAAGYPGAVIPGAYDNGSGVVDIMAASKALAASPIKPKRSIVFLFLGGEECGLCGSEFYCKNPIIPRKDVVGYFNLDMVGVGSGIEVGEIGTFPEIKKAFKDANDKYIHRPLRVTDPAAKYYGRPQVDQDIFKRAGYRAFYMTNFFQKGEKRTKYYYHKTGDTVDTLNVELMQDVARLIFVGLTNMANADDIIQK